MALNLYRRHGSRCIGGRALHDMSYDGDETRRAWKKCYCPNYASGTIGKTIKRRNTERLEWPDAKAVADAWNASGWDSAQARALLAHS